MYALPALRAASLNSPNSGDIVVLANLASGFQFDEEDGLLGEHGSLTFADAVVPIAFASPGGASLPKMLDPIVNYLGSRPVAPFAATPGRLPSGANGNSAPLYDLDAGLYAAPGAGAILTFFGLK